MLVTNTSYYSTPVTCFNQYKGYLIEQMAEVISQNNFQFSVISPRLIQPINIIALSYVNFKKAYFISDKLSGSMGMHSIVYLVNLFLIISIYGSKPNRLCSTRNGERLKIFENSNEFDTIRVSKATVKYFIS